MNIFKNPLVWTIIIFIAAGAFRLTSLDLIEFKLDEARDVYEMERFYSEPYFIQRGTIQSTGVYNPPLWYYILAVLSLPSRNPQYLSFMIALINCLAVVGFYLVVKKFYGQFVGITAGLLLAFSPWMIVFSRKIWAPDLLMVLLVPLFYFLHKIHLEGARAHLRGVGWFWVVLLLSLLAQLHVSGLFLAAAIVITVLARRVKINWKAALLGLSLSLIPLLPYIAYQFQTSCEDCQAYLTYQSGEALGALPFFDSNSFLRPFQFINGSGFQNALGEEGYRDFLDKYPFINILNLIFLLEFGLFILGVIFLCSPVSPRGSQSPPPRWLLILIFVVPLLVFITRTPGHLYYFLIVSPISILVYALSLAHLRKLLHLEGVRAHLPGVITLAVIIVINIIFNFSFYKFLGEEKIIPGDYGAIYSITKEMAEEKNMRIGEYVISLYNNFME
ncbi:glycosyltransferase family 39 protein [Candidatus Daviesbacteria bacterium]|nr:glycosyltransferase family 39 protein [Candidatus Daviesbacteria bacterium]